MSATKGVQKCTQQDFDRLTFLHIFTKNVASGVHLLNFRRKRIASRLIWNQKS